jgi:ABC-type microcin C transport system duplicated ATPase subunit YejF
VDLVTAAEPIAPTGPRPHDKANIVEVDDLKVHFPIRAGFFRGVKGAVKAVDGVTFEVRRGETLGLVGESGCGKSTIGRAMIRLRAPTGGTVRFDGVDLASLDKGDLRRMRRKMQIIFQDPYGSLDPRMTRSDPVRADRHHHLAEGGEAGADRGPAQARRFDPKYVKRYPTSSPAGSANGSASPGPLPSSPNSSCATNRSPPLMSRSRHRSSTCSPTCDHGWA